MQRRVTLRLISACVPMYSSGAARRAPLDVSVFETKRHEDKNAVQQKCKSTNIRNQLPFVVDVKSDFVVSEP